MFLALISWARFAHVMLSYKKIGQFRISRDARFPDIPLHGRDLRRQRLVDGSMNGGIRREGSCLLPFPVFCFPICAAVY